MMSLSSLLLLMSLSAHAVAFMTLHTTPVHHGVRNRIAMASSREEGGAAAPTAATRRAWAARTGASAGAALAAALPAKALDGVLNDQGRWVGYDRGGDNKLSLIQNDYW